MIVRYLGIKHPILTTAFVGLLVACGGADVDTPNTSSQAALTGRVESDDGNQQESPGLAVAVNARTALIASAKVATLRTVGGDVLATADIDAEGRFKLESTSAVAGPILVEVRATASGDAVGSAILAEGIALGETSVVVPISHETTVEAEAYVEIAASGRSASEIDTVALATAVSAEAAASVDSGAAIADAVWTSQLAARAAIEAQGNVGVTAAKLQSARLEAYGRLVAALDAATSATAEAAAWTTFHSESATAIAASGLATMSQQARAETAASYALSARAEAAGSTRVSASTVDALEILAARAAVRAEWAAQRAALVSATTDASLRARLDAAYQSFMSGSAQAADISAIAELHANLQSELHGTGSISETVVGTSGDARVQLAQAFSASADAGLRFRSALAAASTQTSAELAASMATAVERLQVELTSAMSGATAIDVAARAFIMEASSTTEAGADALLSLSIPPAAVGVTTYDLTGGLQGGADAIVSMIAVPDLDAADRVRVVQIAASGTAAVIAEGDMTSMIQVPADLGPRSGLRAVELLAGGQVVGSALIRGNLVSGQTVSLPPLTTESMTEADVFAELIADGTGAASIDRAFIAMMIDGPTALVAQADGEVETLAAAIVAAQAVYAAQLGVSVDAIAAAGADALANLESELRTAPNRSDEAHATFRTRLTASIESATGASTQVQAMARAAASATFIATVNGLGGSASRVAATVRGRAQLEAAAAFAAATEAQLQAANVSAGLIAQLQSDLRALDTGIRTAADASAIASAAATFNTAIHGDLMVQGIVGTFLENRYPMNVAVSTAYAASFAAVASAEAQYASAIAAAVTASASGAGSVDAVALASAVAQAQTTLEQSVRAAVDLSALPGVSAADATVVADLTARVSAAAFGRI